MTYYIIILIIMIIIIYLLTILYKTYSSIVKIDYNYMNYMNYMNNLNNVDNMDNIDNIVNLDEIDNLSLIEKKYGKKYPLADDKFQIIHYPKYSSFFTQFKNFVYLIKKTDNQIGTCCFANLKKDIYYVCDLKKMSIGDEDKKQQKNFTYEFFTYGYIYGIYNAFGIIMEPNPIINSLATKYDYKKILTLNLYKITFEKLKKNFDLILEIFPEFYIVEGYKKFVLEKNNKILNCFHIAQNKDFEIILKQNKISFDKINDNDNIMFCINSTNDYNKKLQLANMDVENQMSIIANKNYTKTEFDFDLIKTYMI